MTRIVLDTNVLDSAFPDEKGIPRSLLQLWLAREFELVVSEHIL
jgi:predicted nucleic acid-binding protein